MALKYMNQSSRWMTKVYFEKIKKLGRIVEIRTRTIEIVIGNKKGRIYEN